MSDTIPVTQIADAAVAAEKAIFAAPSAPEPSWAKPAVAVLALVLFGAMIGVCVVTGYRDGMNLLIGSVITMATTAVSYYLGSSSGSDRKTNLLAAAPPVTVK